MKSLLPIFLQKWIKISIVFSILAVISCTHQNQQKSETIELTAWVTYKGPEEKQFLELTQRFSKLYEEKTGKKVVIHSKQVPFDDLITNIKMACMTNRTPDIARVDVLKVLELAYHKVLVKLDSLPNFEEKNIEEKGAQFMPVPFYTNVVDVKDRAGKQVRHLYGLPEQTTCLALFWNRRLFREAAADLEKAGLDPKRAPKTWDELIQYARVLTRKEGDEQRYGFAMNNSLWWTLPFFGVYGTQFVQNDSQGKKICSLGDPLSSAALQLKVDLYEKYKVEAGAWKSGAIGPDVGFVNEKYAMILMGPWKVEEFRQKKLDFGVSLIPSISQKEAQRLGIRSVPPSATNVGGNNFVIFESCQHREAAYEFLKYLTSWENQLEWCLELKQIPVNKKASDILLGKIPHPHGKKMEVDPVIQVFMEQIRHAILPPQLPRMGYIESDVVNPEMELALKGVKSAQEALSAAAEKINKNVLSLVNE